MRFWRRPRFLTRLFACSSGSIAIAGSRFWPLWGRRIKLADFWERGMLDGLKLKVDFRSMPPPLRIGNGLWFSHSSTWRWYFLDMSFKNIWLLLTPRLDLERDFCRTLIPYFGLLERDLSNYSFSIVTVSFNFDSILTSTTIDISFSSNIFAGFLFYSSIY